MLFQSREKKFYNINYKEELSVLHFTSFSEQKEDIRRKDEAIQEMKMKLDETSALLEDLKLKGEAWSVCPDLDDVKCSYYSSPNIWLLFRVFYITSSVTQLFINIWPLITTQIRRIA